MKRKLKWIALAWILSCVAVVAAGGWFPLNGNFAMATTKAPGTTAPFVTPGPAAATQCPPYSFVNNTNLAKNPAFEVAGPNGPSVSWQAGGPSTPPSAANNWLMHSSNSSAPVSSDLVPTSLPGGGSKMLHFVAGGNEGGIYQLSPSAPAKVMFSIWVLVKRGQVAVQASGGNQGPTSWSTRHGEWEQLRVCTDGTVPTGMFIIWNEDASGGEFLVDRAEIRQTP